MIDFEQVGFTYDGETFVLDGLSLHVERGEFVCILGGNGSGKSTLAKHINALLVPDRGRVNVLDADTADAGNLYFIRSSAGMVFQNPDDQIVASLVENDVAFGPENLGVPSEQLRERVTAALKQVGLQGFETFETSSLSGGQKQRVAIAGVLAMEPQILVLDEASAMLDPRGRAGLARVCRELNEAGMTIVAITHFMEEAARADRVYVLDGGKVVAQGAPREVLTDVAALEARSLDVPFAAKASKRLQDAGMDIPLCVTEEELVDGIARALGADSAAGAANSPAGDSAAEPADADTSSAAPSPAFEASTELIRFEQVSFDYEEPASRRARGRKKAQAETKWGNTPDQEWTLSGIDFSLHEGEFFGIAGHTGSGKSTLLQHMNGLLHPSRGRVLVEGRDLADKSVATQARQQVGLVFQYPENQLFAATVFEDVAFGPRNLGVKEDEVSQRYEQAMEMVGLDAKQLREVSPFELSGGQQRRVAFASVLAMRPRTLILDEPAAGLDPKAHVEFLRLIESFHAQGMTVVMVSHNMDDLARMCNRILVLNQGRQHALGTPAQVFGDAAACKQIGLDVPSAQRVVNSLRARGIELGQPAPNRAGAARADAGANAGAASLFDLDSLVDALASHGEGRR